MDVQKFTIRRTTASASTWSLPCTGGTNFYPINLSTNCSGVTMYDSTGSEVVNALESGVMSSFPNELRDCSPTQPCVILWDAPLSISPTNCTNPEGYNYVLFKGLILTSGSTFYQNSYNELSTIYDVTNTNVNQTLSSQGINAFWDESIAICECLDPLDSVLYNIPLTLTQDYNDIGHYSVWDGRVDQQQTFSNFVFTANTTGNGMKIQVYNTTDFGSYNAFQNSPYTISWGECDCSVPLNGNGYPCCEDLQYPSLTSDYEYVVASQYSITITHEGPWGPTSVSQRITVPNLTYNQILAQVYSPAPPTGAGMGGPLSPSTPGGDPYQVDLSGPNPIPSVYLAPLFTSTAYHGTYGVFGSPNYYPLDSGTNINQYSGTSIGCFELTGITDSTVGIFSTYSNAPSTLAPGFLPNGFELFVSLPVGGDVVDPITNTITAGMMGSIFNADALYTGYTISSANGQTPIDFYDFPNGITIFVATSCGLNSLAFGGEDCFECPEETCEFCLTKDEFINRVTLQPEMISTLSPASPPNWSPFVDYVQGDIVYDVSPQDCCCYVVVAELGITQTSTSGLNDPFAGVMPSQMYQGVWLNPTGADVHVFEGCTPDCVSCPAGSALPCADPYNVFNAYSPMGPVGIAGQWDNSQVFTQGQFIYGPDGNCYQAITSIPTGIIPTAMTNSNLWDYVGCVSWVCPQDLASPGPYICEMISGSTPDSFTFYGGPGGCVTAYNNGNCPVSDRWHCENQYGCDMPGCQEIDYTHPQYNNVGYPLSVTFSSMTDCESWCNPIAWSCTTPTATPCCSEVSCFTVAPSDYYTIMTNYVLTTPLLTANLNQLFLDPYYGISDCELGVSLQGISACCNFAAWEYFCDQGCVEIVGGGFPDEISCQTAPGNNSGIPGPCGWDCYDPWSQPCSGGTGFPGSSACVPCYTNACGQYTTSGDCCNWCQPPLTECWVCLSGSATACQNLAPCPTPLPAWESDWYVDPALVPLSGFGANPNFSNFSYPLGSFVNAVDCEDNCPTEGGVDCLENMTDGTSYGQCINWPNPVALPSGYGWSPGGPYESFSACCIATGCCDIECDESAQIFDPMSGLYDPSWPWWPCVYIAVVGGNPPPTPLGPIYGTMAQCVADNPTGCVSDEITCDCACDPLTGGQGNDQEVFVSLGGDYTLYDYVSYPGGTPSTCCYYCDLPQYSNPFTGTPPGFYDCNYFVPEGPDAPNGIPNAWISCGSTPSGATTGGCDPCSAPSADTYSCDYIDGCVQNPIPCSYVFGSEAALNCYTASTCQDHCKSGCYCDENATPADPTDDFTACVMLQDVINGLTTNTSTWYGFFSLWACQQAILLPPPVNLDCCSTLGSKFHCDDSDWCSSLNPGIPGTNGLGCIEVFPGDILYSIAAYTNLSDCVTNCKWACDVATTLGTCQFVGNNPNGLFPEHSSAFDCFQNTNQCDCTTPGLWFCDTNAGQSATTSNCFQEGVIQAWQTTAPFISWTDNLVFGQGGTSTPYSTGTALGFASQSDCQQACRFCCDSVVSCTCDLNPYNFNCSISIQDCVNAQTNYPCCPLVTEWCCDETLGCVSFVGTMPAGCIHGPFGNPADCQDECNFICGECTPDLGPTFQPDPCQCSLITTPFYTAAPPYTNCTAYNNLLDCQNNSYSLGGIGSNNTTCCPCQDCQLAGSVTFPVINMGGGWALHTVGINLPIAGSIIQSDPWVSTINYLSGDTVTHCGSGGTCCCYVNVVDAYSTLTQGLYNPSEWYNLYSNSLANSLVTEYGDPLVWIPCDTSCPTTATTSMYECLPGQPIYTFCDSATMEFPINPVGTTWPGNQGINAGTNTWAWCLIFFDWIVQTYPPNTPFDGKKAVSPNGVNPACPNYTTQYGGNGGIYLTRPSCHITNTMYNAANGCSGIFIDWNDAIAQLNLVNTNLSLPPTFNTGMSVDDAKVEMFSYGETTSHPLYAGTSGCQCSQTGPCYCQPCIGGANCIWSDLSLCNIAANATPCCVPPVTGFWVCDTGNPNQSTGVCPCIYDPLAVVGYNSEPLCTGDTLTCCYEPPVNPVLWTCIDTSGSTETLAQSQCGLNKIYIGNKANDTQALNGIVATVTSNPADYYNQFGLYYWSNTGGGLCNASPCPPSPNYSYTQCEDSNGYCLNYTTYLDIVGPAASLFNANGFTSWGDVIDHLNSVVITNSWSLAFAYTDTVGTCFVKMGINEGTSWSGGDFWVTDGVTFCRCYCECHCEEDINGLYASQLLCEQSINSCCGTIIEPSWDCDPHSCLCLDPGTGLGFYTSANGGLAQCNIDCCPTILGCDDCDQLLQLPGAPIYMGSYNSSTTYQINECVFDPNDNDCCYCCAPFVVGPALAVSSSLQTLLFNASSPAYCKDGQGDPSAIVGINIGGGMWIPCGVNNLNQICTNVISPVCESCDITLVNDLPTPVTFPWNPGYGPPGQIYLSFNIGECIYDVDPLGTGDNCCWCCACEYGWDGNNCIEPIPIANGPLARRMGETPQKNVEFGNASKSMNPPACGIGHITNNDPNTGTYYVNASSWNSIWAPCGGTSTNQACGGTSSSSSSISPVSSIHA